MESPSHLPPVASSKSPPSAEHWVDQHADALYRFALKQVRDPDAAEELVQETFVSALRTFAQFDGRSSERTWLIAILKHKIMDRARKLLRERPVSELVPDSDDAIEAAFDGAGHWRRMPQAWTQPASNLNRDELRMALDRCCEKLPDAYRMVFRLREMAGISVEEICKELNLTPTNVWTLLHRARFRLRQCLESTYFRGENAPG